MLARDYVKKGECTVKDLGALDELLLEYFYRRRFGLRLEAIVRTLGWGACGNALECGYAFCN